MARCFSPGRRAWADSVHAAEPEAANHGVEAGEVARRGLKHPATGGPTVAAVSHGHEKAAPETGAAERVRSPSYFLVTAAVFVVL